MKEGFTFSKVSLMFLKKVMYEIFLETEKSRFFNLTRRPQILKSLKE